MKTVLFIPGFKGDLGSTDYHYKNAVQAIKSRGYETKFVSVKWQRTTVEDWLKEFEETYNNYDETKTIIAGFSYGAVPAILAASKRNPSALWLFSISARFREDLPKLPQSTLRRISKSRLTAFNNLYFTDIARDIKCKTLIFIGGAEADVDPPLLERAKIANKLIKNSKLIFMPDVPHDVGHPSYIKAIQQNI